MRAQAQSRVLVAGFGVTGSLLAAIGATFLVAGGVLAFNHWPSGALDAPTQSLRIAPAAGATATSAPTIALPAAAPAAGRAAPAAAPATARVRRPGAGTPRGDIALVPARTGNGPDAPGTPTQTPPAADPPSPGAVAGVVGATTSSAAGAVRSLGRLVPAVAPVTDGAAGVLDQSGAAVGGLLSGLTHRR